MLLARARIQDERGAALILSVLFLAFAVMPFMVFVVDVGNWWVHKRHLQLQVDAAALAGGDLFGECFSNNGGPQTSPTSVTDAMKNEANKYGGVTGGSYNGQIGGANQGSLSMLFNSQTYTNSEADPEYGTPAFPATSSSDPFPFCTSQVLDVKSTESNLPLFFNGIVPGLSVIPAINRHARVQLYQVKSAKKSLPLAVPDTSPSNVFVTLWNMATGAHTDTALAAAGTSGAPNYLNKWSSSSVPLPSCSAPCEIGLRVGVGNTGPPSVNCYNTAGVDGSYQCYDQGTSTPLVVIRGYDSSGTPGSLVSGSAFPAPILRDVTETTCTDPDTGSPSPFFSADVAYSPACNTPVSATVTAHVDWPSCGGYTPCTFTVTATDQNGTAKTMTSCGGNCYSTSFSYPGADGQDWVKLSWSYTITNHNPLFRCGGSFALKCTGPDVTFPPAVPGYHQQAYSADSDLDVSGPVKAVSVSQYTFAGGSPTLNVTVGLETNLKSLPVPSPTTVMRVYSGTSNRTSVIGCDGANDADVKAAFESGCKTPYQLNPTQSCNPDPAPAGPADCVPVKTGNLGNSIMNALDTRFGCPNVNWPAFTADPPDPRIVQVMITDTSALLGAQGGGKVPVTNFANFYVTGWARYQGGSWKQTCNKNDPVPAGLSAKRGAVAMWGHYIKFVPGPSGDIPGPTLCISPGNNVIPCVPVLVR